MTKFKYIGDGDSCHGVPARDVSSDELSDEQVKAVKASDLYREVKSSKVSKKKEVSE